MARVGVDDPLERDGVGGGGGVDRDGGALGPGIGGGGGATGGEITLRVGVGVAAEEGFLDVIGGGGGLDTPGSGGGGAFGGMASIGGLFERSGISELGLGAGFNGVLRRLATNGFDACVGKDSVD